MLDLVPGTIPELGLALREQFISTFVHHGLRSVQPSNGFSAAVSVCTKPASETTSDFGRRVGQLTLGCERTDAADRLGRLGAQSNLPVVRLTETGQVRAPAESTPSLGYSWGPLPMLFLSAGYPNYFSSPN